MPAADYQGRVVDVLAFQPAARKDPLIQAVANEETSGSLCTGVDKLAQRWVLEFLTEIGSMPYLPGRGCSFMTAARLGGLLTEFSVFSEFALAGAQIQSTLKSEDRTSDSDDERFASARLLSVTLQPGFANLKVQITSVAGDTRRVVLPIQVGV